MSLQDIGNHLGSHLEVPVTYAITAVLSIALYNVLELTFLLFITFRRRSGLYFWSFLISSWGIAIYSIGFILNDFNLTDSISSLYVTFIVLGWCAMVTGQSLVLYSRLHLIVRRKKVLSFVRGMIIVNAIILHIPTIILCYGANSSQYPRFALPYAVFEKVQVSVFFVQESIISGLYVYQTIRFLRSWGTLDEMHAEAGRRLMQNLLYMNIIVAFLDISILVLEYAGRYALQTAVKGLVYSVKLKLEFNILNRLVELANGSIGLVSWLDYRDGNRHIQHGRDIDINLRSRKCFVWALFANRVKKAIIGVVDEQATEREVVIVNDEQSRTTNRRAPGAVI